MTVSAYLETEYAHAVTVWIIMCLPPNGADLETWRYRALEARYRCSNVEVLRSAGSMKM